MAILSITVRILIEYNFHTTSLLYVGIPFVTAIILILIRSPQESTNFKQRYKNRIIDAFIIMLGSSILLFEGFVCVVMFMPIYLIVIMIMFIVNLRRERAKIQNKNNLAVHILPIIIILSAFEGVSPQLSFDRYEHVSASKVVNASIADIKNNLTLPMNLQTSRPWFLNLFPMPYDIKAGTLSPGDVHEIHFKYYRWFFTNLHKGRMLLEISEVENNRIKTTFLDDTSYIANYVKLNGTEINMSPIDDGHTKITLTISFERKLDPYWYFAPVERYAIKKTAEFLITEVIARDNK